MKRYMNILCGLFSSTLMLSVIMSCSSENGAAGNAPFKGGANLVVRVERPDASRLTRAESERNDRNRIDNMNIVLADALGTIQKILYIDNTANPDGNIPAEESGLIQGSLPSSDSDIYYHVGTVDMQGISKMYIVCNYRDVNGNGQYINVGDLNPLLGKELNTIDDLKNLKQGTQWVGGIQTSTLFGEAVLAEDYDEHGGTKYEAVLKRTTAMVTVQIDNDGLNDGVEITPHSIQLCNVPERCYIGRDNAIDDGDIAGHADGLQQFVTHWDVLKNGGAMSVGGHGTDESVVPLFMFENLQGIDNSSGGDQIKKEPIEGKENRCSYLEVTADYKYTPTRQGVGQKFISGTIKYRFCLGENETVDFNVARNKHYQVTLKLRRMGGLKEDGLTDGDGVWIADNDNPDLSWRVESGVTSGGSFVSDGVDMSSIGYLSYVPFVPEEGHTYSIGSPDGVNAAIWLTTECQYVWSSPGYDPTTKIYDGKDVDGGDPNMSYIRVYACCWMDTEWTNEASFGGTVGDISTLQNWIENGYREAKLVLHDNTTGRDVDEITFRQWLPMPVMEPDLDSEDPRKANLYYSRIDVYEGETMRWGPEYYDGWNGSLNISFNELVHSPSSGNTWSAKFGFDMCAAMYNTDKGKYFDDTFGGNSGRPENAMAVALWRAANAQTGTSPTMPPFTQFMKVGLPTKEEWAKIRQYGTSDPRFPVGNVPYWTSSMENGQSYIFRFYDGDNGVSELRPRSEMHRVRLEYHKNDRAILNYY